MKKKVDVEYVKKLLLDPEEQEKVPLGVLQELVLYFKSLPKATELPFPSPGHMAMELTKGSYEPYVMPRHLQVLNLWLHELEKGKRQRIMVNMPPRHGKSETISKWLPFWWLCKHPTHRIILVTYGSEFAAEWGEKVRSLVLEHGAQFGLELDTSSSAKDFWKLKSGGSMATVGAMGPLTGRGANLLIVDDLLKNSEEAASEVMREKMWEWWWTTAYTRLEPKAKVCVLGTRWHVDDLLGRLEKQHKDGILDWDIMKFMAQAEEGDPLGRQPGEWLWPERYDPEAMEIKKKGTPPKAWSALFQQNPIPGSGSGVKREYWKFYYAGHPPETDIQIQSWDLAFKDLATSDYCVGQIWGRRGVDIYLLDQIRERMDAPETIYAIKNWAKIFPRAKAKLIEEKANGPAVIQMLQHEVGGIMPVKTKESKDARLQAVIPYIAAGNVYLPGKKDLSGKWEPAYPWVSEFIEECAAFPEGKNDDMVDSMSQGLKYLEPQGWLELERAHKEALIGPPPKDNEEARVRSFAAHVKKQLRAFEKKHNMPAHAAASRKLW
jgi:predicted phage terminase large subunit-like protein